MPPSHPHLVIIGAPKCATTSLARWLQGVDDTFVPVAKELRYLDHEWDRGPGWYAEQFAPARADQWRVEATPTYLAHPEAPRRARSLGDDTRFVAVLRDPVDRAWSHYWFRRGMAPDDPSAARPFEEVVEEELARDCPPDGILTHGRYAAHLARWSDAVGADRLLALHFEDVCGAPTTAVHRVRDFAGMPRATLPSTIGEVHNSRHELRWPALRTFMLRHRLWRRLPFDLGFTLDRWNQRPREYPPVPDTAASRLRVLHAPDVRAMTAWTGHPAATAP